MEWVDVASKLSQIPISIILMLVVGYLYREKTKSEDACHKELAALTERYHTLVAAQVETLSELEERLR